MEVVMKKHSLLKRLVKPFIAAAMGVMMLTPVFAEAADDYEFDETEVIDFCVYNIWAESFVTPPASTIESIWMSVEVSDYSGDPIEAKLYSRETVTWETHASEKQTIDKDGTYIFYLAFDNEFTGADLATIYVKDYLCALADEDPEGEAKGESGIAAHFVLNEVRFNVDADGNEPGAATTDPEPTADGGDTEPTADEVKEETSDAAASAVTTTGTTSTASEDDDSSSLPIIIGIIAAVVVVIVVIAVATKGKKGSAASSEGNKTE